MRLNDLEASLVVIQVRVELVVNQLGEGIERRVKVVVYIWQHSV